VSDPDAVAGVVFAKAAAYEELTRELSREIGIEWSPAMPPDWVTSMILSRVRSDLRIPRVPTPQRRRLRWPLRRPGALSYAERLAGRRRSVT